MGEKTNPLQVLWGVLTGVVTLLSDWNRFLGLLVPTVACDSRLGCDVKGIMGSLVGFCFPANPCLSDHTADTVCCGAVEFQLHELGVGGPQWNLNYTEKSEKKADLVP